MFNEEELKKLITDVLEKTIQEYSDMCKECILSGDAWGAEEYHKKEQALKEILERARNNKLD